MAKAVMQLRKMTRKDAERVSGMVDTRVTKAPEGIMADDSMVLKRKNRR